MSPISEKVSGLIITYNEEKNIREVLPCFDFCDEIIIVDSFSTDSTVAIAQSFPKVKVIQHKFEDFASQRNVALQHAQNDWVLFLDGDERITPELRTEIVQTRKTLIISGDYFSLLGNLYTFQAHKVIRIFVCSASLNAITYLNAKCTKHLR